MGVLMGSVFMANGANAAVNGSSVDLTFKGVIQPTTCELIAEETQKDIDFGVLPPAVGQGESAAQNVILTFRGCPAEEGLVSKVSVTLSGEEGLADALKIIPDEGASLKDTDLGIQLFDRNGNLIKIGVPSEIADISGDSLKVMLDAKVKGNGTVDAGQGAFSSKAVLNVAYL